VALIENLYKKRKIIIEKFYYKKGKKEGIKVYSSPGCHER
jgi:hypothetical protein